MRVPESQAAMFIERVNRFLARCAMGDEEVLAHVPHSGRLTELLVPGAACRVVPVPEDAGRKTVWDLLMVRHGKHWVCIDTRWANALVAEALARGGLPAFAAWPDVEQEVRVHGKRLDFRVSGAREDCYIEVKCVTLVEDGTALFPDAPTSRGAAHLELLAQLKREGHQAALLFVLLRSDAEELLPHARNDPAFAAALAEARRAGVIIQAWATDVHPKHLVLVRAVPVIFA